MNDTPGAVTAPVMLAVCVDNASAELEAEFGYDPRDPLAVTLAIGVSYREPVVWVFARDLLAAGVAAPSGEGDVTVEPALDEDSRLVRITLANGTMATMTASIADVVEFLCQTYELVPSGAEMDHVDLDAEIATLLA